MHSILTTTLKKKYQPTILVVEDNPDNLAYVSTALELFRCRCLTAPNAIEGLSLAQRYQPNLILMDILMPEIDGIELLKILKLDWLTRTIPVVAMTALSGRKARAAIAQAGFDGFLLKPYSLEELEMIIRPYYVDASLN